MCLRFKNKNLFRCWCWCKVLRKSKRIKEMQASNFGRLCINMKPKSLGRIETWNFGGLVLGWRRFLHVKAHFSIVFEMYKTYTFSQRSILKIADILHVQSLIVFQNIGDLADFCKIQTFARICPHQLFYDDNISWNLPELRDIQDYCRRSVYYP